MQGAELSCRILLGAGPAREAIVEGLASAGALSFVAPPAELEVETDPRRLSQVLLNLLSNACKFTVQGEIRLDVEVRGGEVVLHVVDTGPGIAPEDQARLFQPFVQVHDDPYGRLGGTGLGLAISKRICRLLGGELEVRSALGRGSTFSVRHPLAAK